MRTYLTSTTVYTFAELSDEAKKKVVENNYDINVDHEWHESTYEDAERIGCKISAFDTGRASSIEFALTESAKDVCSKIIENHGETCDTYEIAMRLLARLRAIELREGVAEEKELLDICQVDEYDYCDSFRAALTEELEHELGQCYLNILRNEYEYQTSEEAIIESIEANEYEFTEDGTID